MTKAKVGRPTKYTKKLLKDAEEYLDNYEDEGDVIPSIEGLACVLEVGTTTIYEWAKQDDKGEFQDTLAKILAKQARVLLNKGLGGEFNSTITKLALHNHGYSDRAEVETTEIHKLEDCTDEELEAQLQELRKNKE